MPKFKPNHRKNDQAQTNRTQTNKTLIKIREKLLKKYKELWQKK